jgi:hypothetical protein
VAEPTCIQAQPEPEAGRTVCAPPATMRQGQGGGVLCRVGPCFAKSESFRPSSISLITAASRIAGHGRRDVARLSLNSGATWPGQRFSFSAPWKRSTCCLDDCHSRCSRASAQRRAPWCAAVGRAATARRTSRLGPSSAYHSILVIGGDTCRVPPVVRSGTGRFAVRDEDTGPGDKGSPCNGRENPCFPPQEGLTVPVQNKLHRGASNGLESRGG